MFIEHLLHRRLHLTAGLAILEPFLHEDPRLRGGEAFEQRLGGELHLLLLGLGHLLLLEEVVELEFVLAETFAKVAPVLRVQVAGKLQEFLEVALVGYAAGVVVLDDGVQALDEAGAAGILAKHLAELLLHKGAEAGDLDVAVLGWRKSCRSFSKSILLKSQVLPFFAMAKVSPAPGSASACRWPEP